MLLLEVISLKKKRIFIIALILIIIIIVSIVFLNANVFKNEVKVEKDTEEKKQEEESKQELLYSYNVYRCYRHKDSSNALDNIKYKYTKYYEFRELNNKIDINNNMMVAVYKFNTKDDYLKFIEKKIYDDSYIINKDETNLTYTASINTAIMPKTKEVVENYDLTTYLELLKEQGYTNCEIQK